MHTTTSETNYTNEFHQACFKGDLESASNFLKLGVNLNVKFENGKNLLHIACSNNFYGLVSLLMKFGMNEFVRDNLGRTPLHYSALYGNTSIVRYLIERNTFKYGIYGTLTKEYTILSHIS
jgi:ankyrin repeat protein